MTAHESRTAVSAISSAHLIAGDKLRAAVVAVSSAAHAHRYRVHQNELREAD